METDWLSGWLPLLIGILVLCWFRAKRLFVVVLLAYAAAGVVAGASIVDAQVGGSESQGNFLRLDLWAQNLEVTQGRYLLGTGVAGYAPYYGTYVPDRALSTHSNYLDIFSETGIVGSVCFVWFLGATLRVGLDVRRRWRSGFGAGYANASIAALCALTVAMALGDWVIPFVYNQTIAGFRYTVHTWLFLGGLDSMQRMRVT
jgi:O-antigen ligase